MKIIVFLLVAAAAAAAVGYWQFGDALTLDNLVAVGRAPNVEGLGLEKSPPPAKHLGFERRCRS